MKQRGRKRKKDVRKKITEPLQIYIDNMNDRPMNLESGILDDF